MPSKRHVLFVTPYLPSPPRFGGQRRLHELISGLAKTCEVSLLSLVDPTVDNTAAIAASKLYCRRVVTVANDRYHATGVYKRLLQLQSILSTRSHEWIVHKERLFGNALDVMMEADHYDVIQFEFSQMAVCRLGCPSDARSIFCLDEHNIEYDILRRTKGTNAGSVRRIFNWLDWPKLRLEERNAWKSFDGCTLTSRRDEDLLLSDVATTPTLVVPNGVDVEQFSPRPELAIEPMKILFFGAIDYYPNTDAVHFFLREIFPTLKAKYPALRLSVVGQRPPASLLALQSDDVEITGAVDDVRPHLARAAVVIAPLRSGGGTRLKILESMAMGKAVVSTSLGAEGLGVKHGRDLLLADDPEGFALAVGRLLDEPALAKRMGLAARALVSREYTWKSSVAQLSGFYDKLLETRRALDGGLALAS